MEGIVRLRQAEGVRNHLLGCNGESSCTARNDAQSRVKTWKEGVKTPTDGSLVLPGICLPI